MIGFRRPRTNGIKIGHDDVEHEHGHRDAIRDCCGPVCGDSSDLFRHHRRREDVDAYFSDAGAFFASSRDAGAFFAITRKHV